VLQQQNHDDSTNFTVYTNYWCCISQWSNNGFVEQFFIILFACSINCASLLLYYGFYGELYVAQICVYLQFFIHVNTIGSVKRDVGGRPKVKNENRWCVQPFKTSRLFKVVGTDSVYATS